MVVPGSDDEANLLRKRETWKRARDVQQSEIRRKLNLRDAVVGALLVLAFHRLAKKVGIPPFRTAATLMLVSFVRWVYNNRAPPALLAWRVDKEGRPLQEAYVSYPLIGAPGILRDILAKGSSYVQLHTSRVRNFHGAENVAFGGVREIELMDMRDREHFLRANWQNYVKNPPPEVVGSRSGIISFQEVFAEIMGNGIFAVDGDQWKDHRRVASHLFSANGLKNKMQVSFTKHADEMVEAIVGRLKSGPNHSALTLNWQDLMGALTFSTICDVAFGVDPGALQAAHRGEKIDFLVRFDRLQLNCTLRSILPPFVWKTLRYLNVGFERQIREDARETSRYVRKIIADRRASANVEEREDLLSLYIKTARATGKTYMEEEAYLEDAILNAMVAGKDTASSTLISLFKLLSTGPEGPRVEAEMVAEFDRVLGAEGEVTWEKLNELRYAKAVFNEVVRLHPPVGFDFRTAVTDDVLPSGLVIRAGNRVVIPNISIGRDPSLWTSPDEFRPERWFNPDMPDAPVKRVDEYAHPVFWGGPRLCLGKDMAVLEVLTVARRVLKDLRVEVLPHDEKITNGPVQFYEKGLPVRITTRRGWAIGSA